jgi:hypothetical protein
MFEKCSCVSSLFVCFVCLFVLFVRLCSLLTQQQSETGGCQVEGCHGQFDGWQVIRIQYGRVMDLMEIVIAIGQHVPKEDESGHTGGGNNFTSHVLVNARGWYRGQIAQEAVRRAVFDPIIGNV